MDKKKVKELIEDNLLMVDTIEGFDDGDTEQLLNVRRKLNEALEELSKSDWVSVENGLPEYEEDVVVCSTKFPDIVYVTYRENRGNYSENEFTPIMDDNDFILNSSELIGKITHWKLIEKLEVQV